MTSTMVTGINDNGSRLVDPTSRNGATHSSRIIGKEEKGSGSPTIQDRSSDSDDSIEEVFDVQQFDPILAKKMTLVNVAIDEIGMTGFQWKLFFLNGFGYAVDSVSSA